MLGDRWKDADFLRVTGVSTKTLNNWKRGWARPQEAQFDRLEAAFFGANKDYDEWRARLRRLWDEAKDARNQRHRTENKPSGKEAPQAADPDGYDAVDRASDATPHLTRPNVDIGRLPSTFYVRLAGRDLDMALLDAAFAPDSTTKLVSVIAWGGSGKTALVNAWLQRVQAEGYRGADAVLGWSFYKQGTEDRAASSDLFFAWILRLLGVRTGANGPAARGEALARRLRERRILLILDGLEALQFGPGPRFGDLRDPGLHTLLRRYAAEVPCTEGSLVLLTSRVAINDIAQWEKVGSSALLHRLKALPPAAGAELLRDNGVHGTGPKADQQLRDTSQEFGGHPLALSLLAAFLRDVFNGDVRSRDRIGALLPEDAAVADEQLHGHARRVMRSIQTEWLTGDPVLLAVIELVSLFDRPATRECLDALTESGGVPGLSDCFAGPSHRKFPQAVARLRRANLLLPAGDGPEGSLDAHPLIREWFGEGLRRRAPDAWRQAQARLYAHLCGTQEGEHPSREDLEPLYRAIVHGCRADLHVSALMDVYADRICRERPSDDIQNYAGQKLGAVTENLAAVSNFFDEPYETVHISIDDAQRHWVFSEAAFGLRETGRLAEAVQPLQHTVEICVQLQDWIKACKAAYSLSEIHVVNGDLPRALRTIAEARNYAKKADESYWPFLISWYEAQICFLQGRYEDAKSCMRQAIELDLPTYRETFLTTTRRLLSCAIDLRTRNWLKARRNAAELAQVSAALKGRLPLALATLYIALSKFGHLVDAVAAKSVLPAEPKFPKQIQALSRAFDTALDALMATDLGSERPRGHLARARFRICIADWAGATFDLDEADAIAGVGPMRLYLAEIALLRCRIIVARRQGFAPLAMAPVDLYDPKDGISGDAATLLEEARRLIRQCDYFDLLTEWQELAAAIDGTAKLHISSIRV